MSPHKHEFLVVVGTLASGWWTHLTDLQKALAAMAVIAVVAFSAGGLVSQAMMDRTGALRRLTVVEQRADRAERIAVRDSTRIDALEVRQREAMGAISRMEGVLSRLDDRTIRMTCMLSGRPANQCL